MKKSKTKKPLPSSTLDEWRYYILQQSEEKRKKYGLETASSEFDEIECAPEDADITVSL